MTAYYNEFDPYAAQWLRNLISAGHIAPGDVDERSIVDVRPDDLNGYAQVHFFAGIGGWSLALRLAGVGDDERIWTGSCPCQPFSAAGKRKGFDDARHLWPVFRGFIEECRPAVVFGEQVASATDWLRLVRGDLEALEYAVGCMPIEAASAGADHLRDRYWFVADSSSSPRLSTSEQQAVLGAGRRQEGRATAELGGALDASYLGNGGGTRSGRDTRAVPGAQGKGAGERCVAGRVVDEPQPSSVDVAVTDGQGQRRQSEHGEVAGQRGGFDWVIGTDGKARRVKPGVRLLVDGFPGRVGLLRGFGNAIDPRPAAAFITAWRGFRLSAVSDVSSYGGVFD